jgi:hypothetical protein
MRRTVKLIGSGALALMLGLGAIAQASQSGTPAANRVPTKKGHSVGGLFDDIVRPDHDKKAAKNTDADGGKEADADGGKPKHRHLTAKEWREAYIAKHGHALEPVTHPGH